MFAFEKVESKNLKATVEELQRKLAFLEIMNVTSVGTTYVRWGRTECPSTAQLVYHGWYYMI